MKSFDEWIKDLGAPVEPELPEGVVEVRPGYFEAQCVVCERWTDIYCDVSEFEESNHYCGGSPRCCP